MANDKPGTAAVELNLPTTKANGEKKTTWQEKNAKKAEPVVEAPVMEEQGSEQVTAVEPVEASTLPSESTDAANVATTSELAALDPGTGNVRVTTPEATPATPTSEDGTSG